MTVTEVRWADHVPSRLLGSALLAGVLLLILIVAAVRGHTVAGDPVAQPIKAAPQVGDCVTANPHDRGVDLYNLPALPTGPCSGARFGEVVFIVPDFVVPTADAGPLTDPCREHVDPYPGTPAPPPSDGSFVQVAGVEVSLLGPDARQRAAGQNWAPCMVMTPFSIDAAAPVTVDYSLQGAWQRTDDSQLFAVCVDDATSLWPANCRWPHRFEVLGLAFGHGGSHPGIRSGRVSAGGDKALGSSAALDRGDLTTQVVPARPPSNSDGPLTGPDAMTPNSGCFNNCLTSPTDKRAATDRSTARPRRRSRAFEMMQYPIVKSLQMSWAVGHLGPGTCRGRCGP